MGRLEDVFGEVNGASWGGLWCLLGRSLVPLEDVFGSPFRRVYCQGKPEILVQDLVLGASLGRSLGRLEDVFGEVNGASWGGLWGVLRTSLGRSMVPLGEVFGAS